MTSDHYYLPACQRCGCPQVGHVHGACQAAIRLSSDNYEPCRCGHSDPRQDELFEEPQE